MRHSDLSYALYILLAVIMLSACYRPAVDTLLPEFIQAEGLINHNPDSALFILENMQMPPASHRLQHATWALLLTEAQYKGYRDIDNDSLINIAYAYFMTHDDPHPKARTLFMKAALNKLWDNEDTATEYFLEAAREVDQTDDYTLGYLVYSSLANIYLYRLLYDYAEDALNKALEYTRLSGNKGQEASAYVFFGRLYNIRQDTDQSIEYYQKAMEAAREANKPGTLSNALNEIAANYVSKEDYQSALEYTNQAIETRSKLGINLQTSYFTKGEIFSHMGRYDSAYYYLNRLADSDNLYVKRSSLFVMHETKKAEHKYKEALDYYVAAQEVSDSIKKTDRTNTLIEMQAKYNQEKVLNEKNLLQIEKDQVLRQALWGIIFLIIAIGVITYIYQRKLLRKQKTIREHEERIRNYRLRIHENESVINRNESRIIELQREMEENRDVQELLEEQQNAIAEIQSRNEALTRENQELQENITNYSTSLQQKTKEVDTLTTLSDEIKRLRDREKYLCNQLQKQTKVLKELKTNPRYLDTEAWEEVQESVNRLYDNFTIRLSREIPLLTESDIQICCLVKLRLPIPDIATLLAISPASVSKRKLRLKERIIQELGNPFENNYTLDMWLWEY